MVDVLIVLFILSLAIAGGIYVWDDLTALLEEQAAAEIGADHEESDLLLADGLRGPSLTVVGADDLGDVA